MRNLTPTITLTQCTTMSALYVESHRIDQSRARSHLRCGVSGVGGRYTGPMRAWGKRRDGALEQKQIFSRPPEPECLMGRRIGVRDLDAAERQFIRVTNPLRTDKLRDQGETHAAIGRRALQAARWHVRSCHMWGGG